MKKLEAKVRDIGGREVSRQVERAAESIREALVEKRAEEIIVSGKRLARRWLHDPAMRFLGKML